METNGSHVVAKHRSQLPHILDGHLSTPSVQVEAFQRKPRIELTYHKEEGAWTTAYVHAYTFLGEIGLLSPAVRYQAYTQFS